MEDQIDALLKRIERYLKRSKKTPSRFGRDVAKNSALIDRLRSRNVTWRTIGLVQAHLDKEERRDAV